jgi:hypothetical protein
MAKLGTPQASGFGNFEGMDPVPSDLLIYRITLNIPVRPVPVRRPAVADHSDSRQK